MARTNSSPAINNSWMLFADESCTDSKHKCYGIGSLAIAASALNNFNRWFDARRDALGVIGELKWSKLKSSCGPVNLGLELTQTILRSNNARFSCIMVNKNLYKKWSTNKEEAFYTTYVQLIEHQLRFAKSFRLIIDPRSDSYDKQDEVLKIVTNRLARKFSTNGSLEEVTKAPSSNLVQGIQAADFLTGVFASAHNHALDKSTPLSSGKLAAIDTIAKTLGLASLACDTFPQEKFNVWHFPMEWRGDTALAGMESQRITPDYSVAPITRSDLQKYGDMIDQF